MIDWHSMDESPKTNIDIILLSKDGNLFAGYLSDKEQQYKVITRYELQDNGFYSPFYSMINKKYFTFWTEVE